MEIVLMVLLFVIGALLIKSLLSLNKIKGPRIVYIPPCKRLLDNWKLDSHCFNLDQKKSHAPDQIFGIGWCDMKDEGYI
jgi:hypothetical protein